MRGHLASIISLALRNLSLFTFVTRDPRVSNVRCSSSQSHRETSQSTLTAARAIIVSTLCVSHSSPTPCVWKLNSVSSVTPHCSLPGPTVLIHCWMSRAARRRLVTAHYGSRSPGVLVTVSAVSSGPCHHPPSYVRMTSGIG